YDVELLVWDRQNTLDIGNYDYKIHKFNFKSPYDSFLAIVYLPIWWIYEFYFLIINNYDLFHACDLDTLLPAIIIKKLKGSKLFYIIYDFYASNLPDGKFQSLRKFIRMLVASIEKKSIQSVNVLFLVDENRYEQIEGAKIDNLIYIYNSPQDMFIPPPEEKKLEKDLIIFYGGSLDRTRGLEYTITALKTLNHVKLIIAGLGNDKDGIEIESKKNEKIEYLGWLSHDEILNESLKADVLFAFYDPKVPNNRYASPNKLFESMMCEKPIIINSETSASRIVQEESSGILVPYGDVDSIKKAIIKLRDNPNFRKNLGVNGRKAYESKYNWKIMEKRLLNAYKIN
ncbi:MAG: glycosyltransferase family 4 protein, partial [Methanobacterium paludis]|nr:glycosyltransferase family 4 protein [Methanobacterium paludis]